MDSHFSKKFTGIHIEGDLKTSTTEFIVQVAPQMVCDQEWKEIVKRRSEEGITNNVEMSENSNLSSSY